MLSLPSNIEPRPDKILNVHSHLSTTLTPFNSDVPFFKTLIPSGLMILPQNAMMLNKLSTWFKKNISLWKYYDQKADFHICDVFDLIWPSNDLKMTFSNDQSGRIPLPNLKNKKLHIWIPHLLQLSVYNQSYGEKCYPYPTILSPEMTRYWMCIVIFQPLSRPSIVTSLSLEYLLWMG